ncbi:fibronectin type III domain-containing protein [Halomicroarcula sp. F13]|uniref:Fibronectin type III domain-containing protein n=1 Tax=Haloarcula rubra TaxID=2487747 RepID=A0AAW4PWV1_9EURY|nr:fibronectin type III domain-containing protein [Halomicroarcula rubra]MBX0325796.1 fibronectin type III domain-containing protein [Halomicroarcula rubra]
MPVQFTTDLPDVAQPDLGNGVEDEIAVDWTDVINYGEYAVQYRETTSSTWLAGPTVDDTASSATITGLEDGEAYEVRIRTQTEHVDGAWTTPTSITTKFPGASSLSVDAVTTTSVDLSWTDNSDNEDGFEIQRAKQYDTGWGPWRTLDDLAPNTTSYTDDTAQPEREYRYRIYAYTEDTDAYSNTVSTTTTSAGVQQRRVPATGWHVEIDHPNAAAPLTPQVLADGVEFPHKVNALPEIRIPVPKSDHWLRSDQLEEQPMRVWYEGKRLPITKLQNVRERPDRVILEGNGGDALKERVQAEYVEEEVPVAVRSLVDQTGLARNVDDPQSTVTTDNRMQSADSTSEWQDRLASVPSTDPTLVENGKLTSDQTAWFVEAENADTQLIINSELSTPGDVASNETMLNITEYELNNTHPEVSHTFTTEHAIPADQVGVAMRVEFYGDLDSNNLSHGVTLFVDGNEVGAYPRNVDTNGLVWHTSVGADNISTLSAGDHEVTAKVTEQGTADEPGFNIDCVAFYDNRYTPGFTENVSNGVIEGPDLHPDGVERQTQDATTFLSVVAGELQSAWNDTSGDQQVAISNDQASNWLTAANSSSVSGSFTSATAQIRARFRLSGFDTDPSTSPAGRKQAHEVDLYDLYADLDDTPLLINKTYDEQALEALQNIATFSDSIFALTWDESIGGLRVQWTQPGQRVQETDADLIDYETAKINSGSYDKIVIKGQSKSVQEESVTADVGNAVALDNSPVVEGSGRVAATDGTVYVEGEDYEFNRLPGELVALSGGAISDGESLLVDYNWKVSGSYTAPDAPSSPKTLVRDVPSLPSSRGCEQAALYLYRVVDEPLVEAEATLDELPPTVSIVETLTIPDLPTAGEAVELRDIQQSTGSPTVLLGSRSTISDALQDIRSQLQAVSKIV